MKRFSLMTAFGALIVALATFGVRAQDTSLSFFITSRGTGNGANLGGLDGADKHCQTLAAAVGQGSKTWRAYLSTAQPAVHAKDRIGSGPWFNARAVQVASSVADLHSDANKLSKENSLTEKGEVVNGRGDTPNKHDILTGSNLDGTLATGAANLTCSDWTSASDGSGSAQVGHHDRRRLCAHRQYLAWRGIAAHGRSRDPRGRRLRRPPP